MTVTLDWQIEVNGLLMGPGTSYRLLALSGFEGQPVKGADLPLLGDGTALGVTSRAAREIVFTVLVSSSTPATRASLISAFATAWDIGGDVELHFQIDGIHKKVTGQTRRWGPVKRTPELPSVASWDAEFLCGDPTITVV